MGESSLMQFKFQGRPLRVVMMNGEPVWLAKDVCDVLEIGNPGQAVTRLDEDEKVAVPGTIISNDGGPDRWGVTESGLYSLVLGSRKKEARDFKRWVTREVLPSIRKHGLYAKEELLDNPDLLLDVITKLRDERNARLVAEAQVKELAPKGEFFDRVADATNLQGIAKVAKTLGTGEIRFFRWLRAEGILMQNNVPYQRYIDDGYFEVKQRSFAKPNGEQQTTTTTYVTGKGITWLHKRYAQSHRLAVEA